MYFPTSAARQLCTVPALPNALTEPVIQVCPSTRKSLFCTLTRDGLAVWRVRVRSVSKLAHISCDCLPYTFQSGVGADVSIDFGMVAL